jgi:hypothetical protein
MHINKTKSPYVVYLNKTGFYWAGESLKNVIAVDFARGVYGDLEFQNVRNLDNQMLTMIDEHNLKPGPTIFIVSAELYYSQQFAPGAEDQMKAYMAMIPFEDIASKRFQNTTGQQLIAMSNDLIGPLLESFTRHHFEVLAILPELAFGESLKTSEQFTHDMANYVIKSLVTLQPYSFYTPPRPQENMTSIRDAQGKIFSPRLIAMIVLFVGLIGILITVLFMNGYLGQQKKPGVTPALTKKVSAIQPTVIATQAPTIAASLSAAPDLSVTPTTLPINKTISIEVQHAPDLVTQANTIVSILNQAGFSQLKKTEVASSGQKTLILYRSSVDQATLQAIITSLSNQNIQSSAQESNELIDVDVKIIIAK